MALDRSQPAQAGKPVIGFSSIPVVHCVRLLVAARIEEEARVTHMCWIQSYEMVPPFWSKQSFEEANEMVRKIRYGQKVPANWKSKDGIRGMIIMSSQELRLSHEETDLIVNDICL